MEKKIFLTGKKCFLAAAFVFVIFGLCAPACAAGKTVTVFAAASMTEPMNRIAELYKAAAPDVEVVYNFDSSGTLKTQIQEGAECGLFISAGQRQMDQLDMAASPSVNTEGLDFVTPGTRFDIVSNQVVLITPKGRNASGINSFGDAATDKVSLISIGNGDVPAGQYAREIFTFMGLWDKLETESKISFAGNVKEVLAQVAAAAVDCGVVYSTDAASSPDVEVAAAAPEGSHGPIVYPAAVLKTAKDEAAAMAFAEFLKSSAATDVFKSMGFAVPSSLEK